jgi:CO/xanthine dehydrogenase Mo-binding subunit
MNRRDLLKSGGLLIVGFHVRQGFSGLVGATGFDSGLEQAGRTANGLDGWIVVGNDGIVTAYTGKCELGQGLETAQVQLVAEELSLPMARVRLVMCDTSITPDQGTTSGSQSHPANFNHANLALAAATAREALIDLAAARLRVPRTDLTTADGFVSVRADRSRRVAYAELIGGRTFNVPLNPAVKRKAHGQWTVLGTPAPIVDLPALVTGRVEFVHNVRVPGMLHGRVVRPPGVNATLVSVDESSVAGMPGVVRIVRRGDFLGVVAEKPWQAVQAAEKLRASWKDGEPLPAHATFYEHLRKAESRDAFVVNSGDVDAQFARTKRVVKATYLHPYQMHGAMGTSCAVADVQKDRATVWSSTQAAYALRSTLATMLGLAADRVRVVWTRGSGCYGINGADTVSYDAALLSQAAGRPVRVQLSRQDEMAWENYGFAYAIDQRAALGEDDGISAWDHESWNASLGGRPGYDRPGNVATGRLAGFAPVRVTPSAIVGTPRFNNGSNAAPSYVTGCGSGGCGGTGTIKSERVGTHTIASPFFTGPLRSPSRLQNTFAHESFIDEVAAYVKADPVAYRLRHLRDPRLREVLTAAAKAAQWETRPSPRAGQPRTGLARGRGIACVLYEGDNGYCAMVAEVDVDQATGQIIAKRFVSAQDCGPISNPAGMRNQIEGGALQGLSRALGEEVMWDASKVTSVDWRSYRSLTLGFEPPVIESVLIDRPDSEAMGAGETTITIVAAAVANAIFDATGARIRQVPFTPERVKAALGG